MPLFYQHNINGTTRLAIWEIIEDESFFMEKVFLKNEIHHPWKRRQHLAGRYLLKELFPAFPSALIEIAETRKPFLPGDPFHFSISHSDNFAAAIVSSTLRLGLDIETVTPRITRIRDKYLTAAEQKLIDKDDPTQLSLFWNCKEAIFKWYGRGNVDFKEQMNILNLSMLESHSGEITCLLQKDEGRKLVLPFIIFDSLTMSWVAE